MGCLAIITKDCKPNESDVDLESMDNDSYESNEEFDYGYC